ncbi:acetyl-CoA acetyltransferase [Cohnella xylanilytica]|uniref:acetyl-CoA C-acetyltransferase n=1 Tax=Cohnella xylanilytica TaxID=557555 RepID=A0A841TYX4_9BACL|nr:acetyl-CoA C-acetyltransferase [Cohnella xylanilytica]MBB6693476.1 acetyl-CoA C-acetyltransferase [Cohnella xylanilytica]GIO16616.1 acetyl-CoA acetyltransferase [Cohnella xylanilytica]
MEEAVIVSAVRTPIGKLNGALREKSAAQLGAEVIREALARSGADPASANEAIMGNVLQAGSGQNPARQAALAAGLPPEVPAWTVNKVCGSGLKAIQLAWQAIRCGESEVVVAGGMESMSQAPYLVPDARAGLRMGHGTFVDSLVHDGLWCAIGRHPMGITAENLCERYSIGREELDRFAFESQRRAAEAAREGRFREETIPVEVPAKGGSSATVEADEYPRPDTTLEKLLRLKPAFREDGRVTAGNSSGINDGAAAVVLMSASRARALGAKPLAKLRSAASAGVDPAYMGIGPVPAIRQALSRAGLNETEIGLVELNEAFAAQALACLSHFRFDPSAVNPNGGAIALGHPIGASGARIVVSLVHEMARRGSRYGLAALCIGGGQGMAMVLERA